VDLTTIGGILLAIGCILGGQALEGGHASSILQATAALIVFGGTIGATMVAFPLKDFIRGVKLGKAALTEKKSDLDKLAAQIVELAGLARRDGVLALEGKLAELKDPFLKRALGFVVDGLDQAVTRSTLETEIDTEYEEFAVAAKVFESAGGYAPTVGILGAVLGLIHVMENLSDPSKLGGGIATAFVATVYGVAAANILFLPMANKIKRKLHIEKERKTLIAEGVLSIQAGLNPRVLEEKLAAYAGHHAPPKSADAGGAAAEK
jgi:chemotaxis protein MotA